MRTLHRRSEPSCSTFEQDFVISAVNAGVSLTLVPREGVVAGQALLTSLVAATVNAGTAPLVVGTSVSIRMR
jgi:hypothetical protein